MSTVIHIKAGKDGKVTFENGCKQRIDTLHEYLTETIAAAVISDYDGGSFNLNWDHGKYVAACQAIRVAPKRSWKEVLQEVGMMPEASCFSIISSTTEPQIDEAAFTAPVTTPEAPAGRRWFGLGKKRKKRNEQHGTETD